MIVFIKPIFTMTTYFNDFYTYKANNSLGLQQYLIKTLKNE